MKSMSQEELDELRRQIGTPQPIPSVPQIKDEDMPTIREMVENMKFDELVEETEDLEDDEE